MAAIAIATVGGGCGLLLDLELAGDDGAGDATVRFDAGVPRDAAEALDTGLDASNFDASPPPDGDPPDDATAPFDGIAVDGGRSVPENDRCETAIDLIEGTTDGLTLCGATATLVAACSASGVTAADVFFRVPDMGGTGAWLVEAGAGYLIQEVDPSTCVPTGMCGEGLIHALAGSIIAVERVDGADGCGRTFSLFVSPM
jgi:hypothetical protein